MSEIHETDDELKVRLTEENRLLKNENWELKHKLGAKRYKLIDKAVDETYGVLRRVVRHGGVPASGTEEAAEKTPKRRKFTKGRVDVVAYNFYDWDGRGRYFGGAERYIFDLSLLLQEMGYNVTLWQGANYSFEKTWRGVKIRGIKAVKEDFYALSEIYNRECQETEFIVATSLELAAAITSAPCIAINHGVNFDKPWQTAENFDVWRTAIFIEGLKRAHACVAVDTNFINWTRTMDYGLADKLIYVPNYYDEEVFQVKPARTEDGKIIFVYPRRIYTPRGYDLVIEAFREILGDHPEVIVRFVGQVDSEEVGADLEKFKAEFPGQVEVTEYPIEDAYKAYEDVDVVLVPTRFSEGTSLSCIEAQASGLPVITTTIGGLPNLVIDRYNGRLIAPKAEELKKVALELIEQPEERKRLGKNAREVAKNSFTKTLWEERWKEAIRNFVTEIEAEKEVK